MMNGRMSTVTIDAVASPATSFDLYEIVSTAAKPCRLARLLIGQTSEPTTEEEQLHLTIVRGNTVSGSGGSTPTPGMLISTETAAGYTAETMNTTIANTGIEVKLVSMAWNTRAGIDIAFAPEEGPWSVNAERVCVRCPTAPADAVTIRATLWVEEFG